jgi:hypothetical protein
MEDQLKFPVTANFSIPVNTYPTNIQDRLIFPANTELYTHVDESYGTSAEISSKRSVQ